MNFTQYKIEIYKAEDPWNSRVNTTVWENEVVGVIRKLEQTKAGLVLLKAIGRGSKWVVIEPLNFANVCNAHGGERVGQKTEPSGNIIKYGGVVKFEASVFSTGSSCYFKKNTSSKAADPGGSTDEVFFHELIHAYRSAQGIRRQEALADGMFRYTSFEEFVAVVSSNVYISDITNKPSRFLRGAHRGHDALEKELSGSIAFFRSSPQVLTLMKQLHENDKAFFEGLAGVKAWFNPFWSFIHQRNEAEAASRSDAAKWMDKHDKQTWPAKDKQRWDAERAREAQFNKQQPDLGKAIGSMVDQVRSIFR